MDHFQNVHYRAASAFYQFNTSLPVLCFWYLPLSANITECDKDVNNFWPKLNPNWKQNQ